jgi:hypothetical protein
MNRIEAKNFLLKEFITEYGSTTPVAYDNNEEFVKPDNASWARFSVLNHTSYQATMGGEDNRRFSRYGLILFQVFIPVNTGTYEGDVLCEQILDIFEAKRFGSIVCKTGEYKEIGNTGNDLYQFNGSLPWEVDQTK